MAAVKALDRVFNRVLLAALVVVPVEINRAHPEVLQLPQGRATMAVPTTFTTTIRLAVVVALPAQVNEERQEKPTATPTQVEQAAQVKIGKASGSLGPVAVVAELILPAPAPLVVLAVLAEAVMVTLAIRLEVTGKQELLTLVAAAAAVDMAQPGMAAQES